MCLLLPRRIVQEISDGNFDPASIRQALDSSNINTLQLRADYASALAGQQIQVEEGCRSAEADTLEASTDAATASVPLEECDAKRQPVPSGDEEAGAPAEVQQLDEVEAARLEFMTTRTMSNFRELLKDFSGLRSEDSPAFHTIRDAVRDLDTIDSQQHKEVTDCFHLLINLLEETEDPAVTTRCNTFEHDFLEDIKAKAEHMLGMDAVITIKLWCLSIFLNSPDMKDGVRDYLDLVNDDTTAVRKVFAGGIVPRPNTGILMIDSNLEDDAIRDIRYFFVFALVLIQTGDFMNAKWALKTALRWSLEAEDDENYRAAPDTEASKIDLVLHQSRMLMELGNLAQERGNEMEPAIFYGRAFSLELSNRILLQLPAQYINYLRFVLSDPDFSAAALEQFLESNPDISSKYIAGIVGLLRVKTLTASRSQNFNKALAFLKAGVVYLTEKLQNLDFGDATERCFESLLLRAMYKLVQERYRLRNDFLRLTQDPEDLPAILDSVTGRT